MPLKRWGYDSGVRGMTLTKATSDGDHGVVLEDYVHSYEGVCRDEVIPCRWQDEDVGATTVPLVTAVVRRKPPMRVPSRVPLDTIPNLRRFIA